MGGYVFAQCNVRCNALMPCSYMMRDGCNWDKDEAAAAVVMGGSPSFHRVIVLPLSEQLLGDSGLVTPFPE